ncbi:hypothetical protein HDV02_001996 [Globomyces sp. JEL0801]|nr:hypothetical protein HDV02_001996 [Globomyces sp. JEL0801]
MQVKNVTVQNLSSFAKLHLTSGFQMKGASLLYTSYDEVLFLDSDNIPARDPTFLFDTPAFKETGTLFWKDFWYSSDTNDRKTTSYNPIWSLTNITCIDEFEQESGQVLVRRTSPGVYQSLKLAFYMQKNSDLYFELVLGDKDTFRFAWRLLKTPFHFVRPNIGVAGNEDCNYVMVQFGPFWSRKVHGLPPKGYVERPEPQIAFLHMNLLKYKSFRNNPEFSFITTYANVIVPNGRAEFGGLCTKLHEFTEKGRSYKTKRIRFDRALPGFSALYQKVANRIGDV